jgi:hypothetical protein
VKIGFLGKRKAYVEKKRIEQAIRIRNATFMVIDDLSLE